MTAGLVTKVNIIRSSLLGSQQRQSYYCVRQAPCDRGEGLLSCLVATDVAPDPMLEMMLANQGLPGPLRMTPRQVGLNFSCLGIDAVMQCHIWHEYFSESSACLYKTNPSSIGAFSPI